MKQKLLSTAVAAVLAGGIGGNVQAVNIATDGLGEVLLFPYYTVNNGYDTNINITNTSSAAVVFKIRFREAYNSRDARDFNVVLSPYDVWTATVTESPDGSVARLVTGDNSCTAGQLPGVMADGRRYIDFTNLDYITQPAGNAGPSDFGPADLARTKEGYIEVIQMGHQRPLAGTGPASPELAFTPGSVGYNSQHDPLTGVPRDCNAVRNAFAVGNIEATADAFYEPINVLKGTASLLKADAGKAATFSATVLANFYNPNFPSFVDGTGELGDNLIVSPESTRPGLDEVFPAIAEYLDDRIGAPIAAFFDTEVNAVSAVLSRQSVVNQYSVNPANLASTDWVLTFPTKYYYVDERTPGVGSTALPPFENSSTFQSGANACAPVTVSFRFFDREEAEQVGQETVGFSPAPPGTPADTICYETQVVTFNNTNVLGSPLAANVNVAAAGYNSGWMSLDFTEAGVLESDGVADGPFVFPATFFTGLPVIGFAVTTLENGVSGDNLLNYGLSFDHGYIRDIVVAD